VRAAALLLPVPLLSACMVIPLDPVVPSIEPAPALTGPAATLHVQVEEGAYHDPRSLSGFAVRVDGQVRAWLPGLTGEVRLEVAAGPHRVAVEHPWRDVGLLWGVPWPESGTLRAEVLVQCAPAATCGAAVLPVLDRKGLQLKPRALEPQDNPR
jgi:hypothetical protein